MAANETEIERLVVSIVGDLSSLEDARNDGLSIVKEIDAANQALEETLADVETQAKETAVSEAELEAIINRAGEAVNTALERTVDYSAGLEDLRKELNLTEEQAEFLAEAHEVLVDTVKQIGPGTEEAATFVKEFTEQLTLSLEEMRQQGTEGLDDILDSIHEAQEGVEDFGLAFEDAMDQHLLDSVDAAHDSLEDFVSMLDEVTDELLEMNLRGLQPTQRATEEFSQQTQEAAGSLDELLRGLSAMPGPVGRYTRDLLSNVDAKTRVIKASGSMVTAVLGVGAVLTAVIGPMAGLVAMSYKARRELEALDRTAKKALAMGDSVQEVQALSFALGEIAGMDPRQTEMSLRRLQRSIGAASETGGRASKVYKDLGLDLDELKQKTPTEQFNAVAAAVANYGTASDKARISQQLFGRGAENIVLALTAQNEVLQEAQQFAKDYGLTVDDIQAETLQMSNDAWGRVSEAMGGWMTQLSAELAPLLKVIADTILSWIPPVNSFKWVIDLIVDTSTVILGVYYDLSKVVIGIAKVMKGDWKEGMDMIKEGFAATSAAELLYESEQVRREAEKTAASRKQQAEIEQAITEEMKRQQHLNQSAEKHIEEMQRKLAFMEQEEYGIRSKKIFELQSQGADEELIQAALEFEEKIAVIERQRREAQQQRLAEQKATEEAEKNHLKMVERARQVQFDLLSDREKAEQRSMAQAMELAELLSHGLIDPETFDAGIEKINKGLNQITDQANAFWVAMNGPQMSQFGAGREGLELDLIRQRGGAISELRQREGMDANVANRVGIGQAYQEARNATPGRSADAKLVNVLDLLERHLRMAQNPNKVPVAVAQPGDIT